MTALFQAWPARVRRWVLTWGLGGLLWGLMLVVLQVEVQQAQAPAQARPLQPLPCVSYAPFRREGHAPWNAQLHISPEQLREDLEALRPYTRCVRTYGVSHGQDQVPAVAAALGMQVVLGAWIDRDERASRDQIERALALAHDHPGTVVRLVLGNEVLLRGEQSPHTLAAWLRGARARSPVPVTYADVWEFWRRHATVLSGSVDLAAIHVLPYWEDQPVGGHEALAHVQATTQHMREVLHPLPVWLAETGWPAQGRSRGPAVPSAHTQEALRWGLLAAGDDFNWIEGFDQPWKRSLEGAMGGAWGLLTAEGEPRRPGPALPWWWPAVAALGLTVLHRRAWVAPTVLVAGTGAVLAAWQWGLWARTPWEWTQAVMQWAVVQVAVLGTVMSWISPRRLPGWPAVQGLAWAWMAVDLVALCADGRYRSLHSALWWPWVWVQALQAFQALASPKPPGLQPAESTVRRLAALAPVLALSGVVLVALEGVDNAQALMVSLAALVGAVVLAWPLLRAGRGPGGRSTATAPPLPRHWRSH